MLIDPQFITTDFIDELWMCQEADLFTQNQRVVVDPLLEDGEDQEYQDGDCMI